MSGDNLFEKTTKALKKDQCFVLMPFRQEYEEIYHDIIKPLLEELGYHCLRADEIYGSTAIIQDIWESIQVSGLIIADMTDRNPNVFYELGLCHAIGKNVILITQSLEDVPFDLRHLRCITYKHNLRGLFELRDVLNKSIHNDKRYSNIAVDRLTEGFVGGFIAKDLSILMHFDNEGNKVATGVEDYTIIPEEINFHKFYKKIHIDNGVVARAGVSNGIVSIKKVFTGLYLLTIDFPKTLKVNQQHNFKLEYTIENNFKSKNEYWIYNAEVEVEKFSAKFMFPNLYGVYSFEVYLKNDTGEILIDNQATCDTSTSNTNFLWEYNDMKKGECYIFRWSWQ